MTQDTRRAALVERMARILNQNCFDGCESGDDEMIACVDPPCLCRSMARDLAAVALEEAAKECERIGNASAAKARDYVVDGLIPEARTYSGEVSGTDKAAAAIRALKSTDP